MGWFEDIQNRFAFLGKPHGTQVKEYVYGKGKMPSPPLIVGGIGGTSGILEKMFGAAKAAAPIAAPVRAAGSGLLKPALIAGGGALAGGLLSFLFGGKAGEKKIEQAAAPQYIAPTIVPSQIIEPYVVQPSYIYEITHQEDYSSIAITDSPFASVTKKTSAAMGAEPQWYTPFTTSQETPFSAEQEQGFEATQADGTNMVLLAGIAAVGLIGYGYVSRKQAK